MKSSFSILLASAATLTSAIPQVPAPGGTCPPVWNTISTELTGLFVDPATGQCTDLARAAVRAVFHDCGTWTSAQGNTGGCDGSLFLNAEELARRENRGLQGISETLQGVATRNQVSVADMIVFAGAHATVSCPLGPRMERTMVGRADNPNAAPAGNLPSSPTLTATDILTSMADKGLSSVDTVALVGAHSTARQFNVDTSEARRGQSLDSTPGIWDVAFYSQVGTTPAGVFVFDSDRSLSQDPQSAADFQAFVNNQPFWNFAFGEAFAKLSTLGNGAAALVDCTSALPAAVTTFDGANPPAQAAGNGTATGAARRRSLLAARYQH